MVARICDLADKIDNSDNDNIRATVIGEIEELILSIYS